MMDEFDVLSCWIEIEDDATTLFVLTEVLPLVEFYLEDDITDEEAQNLLDLAPPRDDKRNRDRQWREDRIGSILENGGQ